MGRLGRSALLVMRTGAIPTPVVALLLTYPKSGPLPRWCRRLTARADAPGVDGVGVRLHSRRKR